jgi:hypothetical protein
MHSRRGERESETSVTDALAGKATQHELLTSLLVGSANARGLEGFPERAEVVRLEHAGESLVEDFRVFAGETQRLISGVLCKDLFQGAIFKSPMSRCACSSRAANGPSGGAFLQNAADPLWDCRDAG